MKERMNIEKAEARIYSAMNPAEKYMAGFELDRKFAELLKLRASQINGCDYCVNLHSMDARKAGETEQRIFAVSAWWETPFFTDAERSAFKLAEEITRISELGLTEETYQNAKKYFNETEIA